MIGIDGGGTHTRVGVFSSNLELLAFSEERGCDPRKDPRAQENVRNGVTSVLKKAQIKISDVDCLVAGLSGLNWDEDLPWARQLVDIPGLSCPRYTVNDAVVAHVGAFHDEPGIVVICGTGAIVYGINEDRQGVRNYDLGHYAKSASKHLAYDLFHCVLEGRYSPQDECLIQEMLQFWETDSVEAICTQIDANYGMTGAERDRLFGRMAPIVTHAAYNGIPLAQDICERALEQVVSGIRLVSNSFHRHTVSIALVGSVINSPYMKRRLEEKMSLVPSKRFRLTVPKDSPVMGAAILASQLMGVPAL